MMTEDKRDKENGKMLMIRKKKHAGSDIINIHKDMIVDGNKSVKSESKAIRSYHCMSENSFSTLFLI